MRRRRAGESSSSADALRVSQAPPETTLSSVRRQIKNHSSCDLRGNLCLSSPPLRRTERETLPLTAAIPPHGVKGCALWIENGQKKKSLPLTSEKNDIPLLSLTMTGHKSQSLLTVLSDKICMPAPHA
ncbi:hypothetical protein AAFF_G00356510 [Aldrovandia affinis]|uniref:Uncharacterized protein n=1 Tax=Aldrovandia affinis TaxID=143900 RepID=A0AAD7T8Z0_9TELE|nr:hypothetical protein AAFF_G00356510 [Aldrovandia affinis]